MFAYFQKVFTHFHKCSFNLKNANVFSIFVQTFIEKQFMKLTFSWGFQKCMSLFLKATCTQRWWDRRVVLLRLVRGDDAHCRSTATTVDVDGCYRRRQMLQASTAMLSPTRRRERCWNQQGYLLEPTCGLLEPWSLYATMTTLGCCIHDHHALDPWPPHAASTPTKCWN